ncbi:MAG: hypothetical protein FJX75_28265 [Armatimonadetes bacterium]|nr:hypothetical protein [Armatimonadota bacterium]
MRDRQAQPNCLIGCIGVIAVGVLCGLISALTDGGDGRSRDLSTAPVEQGLASLQEGQWAPANGPTATHFRYYLDSLERKTGTPHQRTADIVVTMQEQLAASGVHESLAECIEHLDQCIPPQGSGGVSLEETAAAYVTMRTTPVH